MTKVRLCHIQCFNATAEMVSDLSIPRERSGGVYEIKCIISAFNPESTEARIFCQVERIKQGVLERAIEAYGARGVMITSFSPVDYATSAAVALQSVLAKCSTPGFQSFRRGVLPSYIQHASTQVTNGIPSEAFKDLGMELEEAENIIARNDSDVQVKVYIFFPFTIDGSQIIFTGAENPGT